LAVSLKTSGELTPGSCHGALRRRNRVFGAAAESPSGDTCFNVTFSPELRLGAFCDELVEGERNRKARH